MLIPFAALLALAQAGATPAPPLPSDPIEADWRAIPDDELLVITLRDGHRVVIRLAARYAPAHIANIRKLAAAHWWDDSAVYRVQENWVTQWGDPTEKKPLPEGVAAKVIPEFEIPAFAPAQRMSKPDGYSALSGITADGWPVASDGQAAWLTHCYGMVGVARDADPESGSGSELFTPIGQSARRLDRNYTVVGRIVEGMQYFSALPRSDAPMGVYATAAEYTPIATVRLASELPEAERPHYQYRAADNVRYAAAIALKEHPKPPMVPIGANVCDLSPGVRKTPAN